MLCSHSKQTLFIRLPEVMGSPDGVAGKEPSAMQETQV